MRPPTLVDFAFTSLRDEIIDGTLAPGAPVRVRDQANRLGVSPIPVREALYRLEQAGLILWVPHQGATVARASLADMEDTYRVRVALETLAIRSAVESFDDEADRAASRWLEKYEQASTAGDRLGAREAHAEFHMALYSAARSQWAHRLIPQLQANAERYRAMALQGRRSPEQRVVEHRRLLEVSRKRQPDLAEEALRHHFELTQDVIRKVLSSSLDIDHGEDLAGRVGRPSPAGVPPPQVGSYTTRNGVDSTDMSHDAPR